MDGHSPSNWISYSSFITLSDNLSIVYSKYDCLYLILSVLAWQISILMYLATNNVFLFSLLKWQNATFSSPSCWGTMGLTCFFNSFVESYPSLILHPAHLHNAWFHLLVLVIFNIFLQELITSMWIWLLYDFCSTIIWSLYIISKSTQYF